jgi:hypothetical protein
MSPRYDMPTGVSVLRLKLSSEMADRRHMIRKARLWLVVGAVTAVAVTGAGWKWTSSGGGKASPAVQLAGWSWDGAHAATADA